ncbi:hypothetical protein ACFLWH_00305 [Chloroflexota bacterium]
MTKKRYTAVTALIAVAVLIGAMALAFPSVIGIAMAQDDPYVLDHFKGYNIKLDSSQPPPENPFVVLQDQFDRRLKTWELKKVGPADMFFNPVAKTVVTAAGETTFTPIPDPRNHLTRFPITSIANMRPETTRWNVFAQNQFHKGQRLLVRPATHILVPTEKDPVIGESSFPVNLDHFKWYPVIRGKPVNIKVTLEDQWGKWEDVMVLTPVAFANPVRKIHLLSGAATGAADINIIEIQHPKAHLVAYKIEPLGPSTPPYTAIISNQFVPDQAIVVQEGNILLVPSAKLRYSPIRNPNLTPAD